MALPDVTKRPQGAARVEPTRGLVHAHGVEVGHLGELLGHVAVAPDDAAAVSHDADDAAVLPVALLLFVRQLELPQKVVAHRARLGSVLDFLDEARPRALLKLVQQFRVPLLIRHH